MNRKGKQSAEKGAFDIIEEAFHLLRQSPFRLLAGYCIGTLPFVLAVAYFWADMSKSAFARTRLPEGTLALTVLFVWMKTWHAVYARTLWAAVAAESPPRWRAADLFRIAARQTIVQPSGLLVLPLALILMIPFGAAYAFYQNFTVLDDGQRGDVRELARKAAHMAALWPKQNHVLIWALSPFLLITAVAFYLVLIPIVAALTPNWTGAFLAVYATLYLLVLAPLSPFGMAVAVNLGLAMLQLPQLLHMLLGVQTVFVQHPSGMLNSTFFAVVCSLTYCCMDPLVKAVYVLRVFYGQSLRNGDDLLIELKRCAAKTSTIIALGLFAFLALLSGAAAAQEAPGDPAPFAAEEAGSGLTGNVLDAATHSDAALEPAQLRVSPEELTRALDRELQERQYAWRLPRSPIPETEEGLIASVLRTIAETMRKWVRMALHWVRSILDWLADHMRPGGEDSAPLSQIGLTLRLFLILLLAGLSAVVGVLLFRLWKQHQRHALDIAALAIQAQPDLENEETCAEQLPEEGWLALARELAEKGELRLALRAAFLATLAHLAQMEWIRIARFKSNREYRNELRRHALAKPETVERFSQSVAVFERVWYGAHETTRDLLERVLANQEELRRCE